MFGQLSIAERFLKKSYFSLEAIQVGKIIQIGKWYGGDKIEFISGTKK